MHCGDLHGREMQKGGVICIHMADSFRCVVEANTSNYTAIKLIKRERKEKVSDPL